MTPDAHQFVSVAAACLHHIALPDSAIRLTTDELLKSTLVFYVGYTPYVISTREVLLVRLAAYCENACDAGNFLFLTWYAGPGNRIRMAAPFAFSINYA